MNEWLMILGMALGGVLFAAGGTGFKWARRFLLPIALGTVALWAGIDIWRCVSMALGLILSLHLGYGQSLPYWRKALTAVSFVLPTMFIGFSLWQVFTPVSFLAMFWLSNSKYFGRLFPWKIVEFNTGVMIGCTVVQLISQTF
jgi:hypothetical protein